MAKYLITGGTGFIGSSFINALPDSDVVYILSRQKKPKRGSIITITSLAELSHDESIDTIINLAGSPIDRRWSASVKNDLLDSRVNTTKEIIQLISRLDNKPKCLISASAVGFYGGHDGETLIESSKPMDSFTHQLCHAWEQQALRANDYGVRTCLMRLGVVIGANKGFIKKINLPFKLGLGGCLGGGQQYFPWISIQDVLKGMFYLIKTENASGIYNFTAPRSVTNHHLTKAIGKTIGRPTLFTMPSFVIKLLFGEMGEELLLKGNIVQPKKLLDEGFSFDYVTIESSLEAAFHGNH